MPTYPAISPDWPGNLWLHALVIGVFLIAFLMVTVMTYIWIERRGLGRFQARLGPNRAGPLGLLQAFADMIKILTKEDIIPSRADRLLFWLAPVAAFVPVVMVLAVIPLWPGLQLADLNTGVLYILAVSGIGTIGIFLSGYAGNNKYGLIGAMRETAQLMSYELPLMLALLSVVILTGSLSITELVAAQDVPFILVQPLGFVVFFLATLAEINRSPFDLVEADSELASGFNIEYSGMKFALLYVVEYSEAVVASVLVATFFLGGWRGPLLPPVVWLLLKMVLVFFVIIWIRATLPRLRIDQALGFAWKYLLPIALFNLVTTALTAVFLPNLSVWVVAPINILLAAAAMVLGARQFKPGHANYERLEP
ncbi:MAG: NADH-quinone oxidoreductase subunit NuoH [Dehalococcoidia bacterium]|nr:NADH-quinone oxidoreductase subunit NuoH [Dehalococcoidia bacterium]